MLTILNNKWFTTQEERFLKAALLRCILSGWDAYWCPSRPMQERVMITRRRHVMLTWV